jgi:hypothetical protein
VWVGNGRITCYRLIWLSFDLSKETQGANVSQR